jgi:hypothetical protein
LKDVGSLFDHYLPELSSKLNIPKFDSSLSPVDFKEKFHSTPERAAKLAVTHEAQNFFYIMLLMKLLDEKRIDLAKEFVIFATMQLTNENARTMDHFIAKVYYYRGLIAEKTGTLRDIVADLFDAYRHASHRDDHQTQATVLNYIMRSYLNDNLYSEAANLISICPCP